jgi:hypothetical protein
MYRGALIVTLCMLVVPGAIAQASVPEWCRALPRAEYKSLERVAVSDPWFEVSKPARGVFASRTSPRRPSVM